MGEDAEKGLVENVMSGLIPGVAVGAFAGSARAYLSGVSDAERTAAMAAARASSRPPSAAALAAMAPTPPLRVIAVTTAMFAAVGGIFTGVEPMVKAMRGKDDVFNGAIAGCAAGSVVGLKSGSVLVSGGTCAAFAAMSAFIETLGLGHMHDYTEKRRRAVYGIVADDEK